jgi:hypothetical protein
MRKFWLKSLAFSLGLLAPAAYAGEPSSPTAAVSLDRPIAVTTANAKTAAVTVPAPAPVVQMQRPVAVGAAGQPGPLPIVDRQVRQSDFETPNTSAQPTYRGQMPDAIIAKPLPVGPGPMNPNVALHTWRPADEPASPEVAPAPTKVTTTPTLTTTPVLSGIPDDCNSSFLSRCLHPFLGDDCSCPSAACPCVDCGADCGGRCLGGRIYGSAEYLLWWYKGQAVPPLVTSGTLSQTTPGALGSPGTTVLFGGRDMENGSHSGGRFFLGYWLCDDHALGLEGGYFFTGPGVTNFSATSGGTPILTRPFINAATGAETTELVAGPGVLAGTVSVQTRSSLWGAEANLRSNVYSGCYNTLDLLAGFRTIGLDEDVIIQERLNVLTGTGGAFNIVDHFQTRNRFYGGQIGADWVHTCGRWDFDLKTKLGIGETQQMVRISGSDVITDPVNGVRTFNGGLLAQPSNIGNFTRNRFAFAPEVGFTVGYHVTEHFRLFAGYNFLYLSSVVRPAEQIDRTVNVNQIAPPIAGGPARPAFTFHSSDFWAQGVTAGIEYRW